MKNAFTESQISCALDSILCRGLSLKLLVLDQDENLNPSSMAIIQTEWQQWCLADNWIGFQVAALTYCLQNGAVLVRWKRGANVENPWRFEVEALPLIMGKITSETSFPYWPGESVTLADAGISPAQAVRMREHFASGCLVPTFHEWMKLAMLAQRLRFSYRFLDDYNILPQFVA